VTWSEKTQAATTTTKPLAGVPTTPGVAPGFVANQASYKYDGRTLVNVGFSSGARNGPPVSKYPMLSIGYIMAGGSRTAIVEGRSAQPPRVGHLQVLNGRTRLELSVRKPVPLLASAFRSHWFLLCIDQLHCRRGAFAPPFDDSWWTQGYYENSLIVFTGGIGAIDGQIPAEERRQFPVDPVIRPIDKRDIGDRHVGGNVTEHSLYLSPANEHIVIGDSSRSIESIVVIASGILLGGSHGCYGADQGWIAFDNDIIHWSVPGDKLRICRMMSSELYADRIKLTSG